MNAPRKISIKLCPQFRLMHSKKLFLLTVLSLFCSMALAHEFWLEPVKFWLKTNEITRIDLMVGEDYKGDHSNGHKYKILKLDHHGNGQKADIRSKVYGDSLSSFYISFQSPGSHLIAFNNTSKFIELEALQFNEYLRTEGLDNVIKLREQSNDTIKAGRELYQRCVKTLVQVGDKPDDSYAINTGMRLEIIPAKNPYEQKSQGMVRFKILFDNKALHNGLVLAWHKVNGKTTHKTLRSDVNGNVAFRIDPVGKWMISTVHMIPTSDSKNGDWQSFWGSYTFVYE